VPDEIQGAGGVVFNASGKVLVLGHVEGTWVFPKGHLEPSESPLEAALREVEEEAGIDARCPDPTQTERTRYRNARGEMRVITWFLLRTSASAPRLGEATFPRGGFFSPDEARALLSFEEDRALLEVMLKRLAAVRT